MLSTKELTPTKVRTVAELGTALGRADAGTLANVTFNPAAIADSCDFQGEVSVIDRLWPKDDTCIRVPMVAGHKPVATMIATTAKESSLRKAQRGTLSFAVNAVNDWKTFQKLIPAILAVFARAFDAFKTGARGMVDFVNGQGSLDVQEDRKTRKPFLSIAPAYLWISVPEAIRKFWLRLNLPATYTARHEDNTERTVPTCYAILPDSQGVIYSRGSVIYRVSADEIYRRFVAIRTAVRNSVNPQLVEQGYNMTMDVQDIAAPIAELPYGHLVERISAYQQNRTFCLSLVDRNGRKSSVTLSVEELERQSAVELKPKDAHQDGCFLNILGDRAIFEGPVTVDAQGQVRFTLIAR